MADYNNSCTSIDSSGSSFYNTPLQSPSESPSHTLSYSDLETTSISLPRQQSRSPESVASESTLRSASTAFHQQQPQHHHQPLSPCDIVDAMARVQQHESPARNELMDALQDINMISFKFNGVQQQIQKLADEMATLQVDFQKKLDRVLQIAYGSASTANEGTSGQPVVQSSSAGRTTSPFVTFAATTSTSRASPAVSTVTNNKTITPTVNKIPLRTAAPAMKAPSTFNKPSAEFRAPLPVKALVPSRTAPVAFAMLTPQLQHKFRRLPALVKGYLTRRLRKTEHVCEILSKLRDMVLEQQRFSEEVIHKKSTPFTEQELQFHQGLMNEVNKYQAQFFHTFFGNTIAERMKIISRSRDLRWERLRSRSSTRLSIRPTAALLEQAANIPAPVVKSPTPLKRTVQKPVPKQKRTKKAAAMEEENWSPRPLRQKRAVDKVQVIRNSDAARQSPTIQKPAVRITRQRKQ